MSTSAPTPAHDVPTPDVPPPGRPTQDPPVRPGRRSPAFRRLTVGWTFTNLADSVLVVLLAVWVKDLTGSDAAAGLVFAAVVAPALLSPLLGQLADRVSRRRMLVVSHLAGALTLAPLLAVRDGGLAWLVLVATVVYSTVGFATGAAQSGLLRDLLPDEDLAAGNGRLTTIDQTFRLVMPAAGAGAYALVGPYPLVVLAVVCFAVAAAVVATVRVRETEPVRDEDRPSLRVELSAGFAHLAGTRPLGGLTVALAIAFAGIGILNGIAVAVIDRGLGLPTEALGPLMSVQGGLAIVAGLTAARVIGRIGAQRTVAVGLVLTGVGLAPLAGSSLAAVVVGMGAVGLGVTWAVVGYVTERQMRTPATLQGRTQAAGNVVMYVPQLVMTTAAAGLVATTDHRLLVAVTVLGVLLGSLAALRGRRA